MSTSNLRQLTLGLTIALTAIVGLGSAAGASEPQTGGDGKAEHFGIAFLGAETSGTESVFRYELTYGGLDDPESTDEDRLSHLAVAGFCVAPIDVEPDFTKGEGSKWDAEALAAAGQVYEITFANAEISNDVDGEPLTTGTSTWTLKKGSGDGSEKTVTSNGPVCGDDDTATPPLTCPGAYDPMTDVNGDEVIDQADCDFVPPFACPGADEPMTDVNGDEVIDQADCDFVPPFVCPGAYDPMTDVNDDGVTDQADCDFVPPTDVEPILVECPKGTMPPAGETAVDSDEDGDADNCVEVLDVPVVTPVVDIPTHETPKAPPAILPVARPQAEVVPVVAGSVATPLAEVQGSAVTRAAALPRTGTSSTGTLTAIGLALVLAGAALRRSGNRRFALVQ